MTATRGMWPARIAGCLVGVAAAAALLVAGRPAEGGSAVGAEVDASAERTGELAIAPAAPATFIHERTLRPGETGTGELQVTNQTGERQAVSIRALPSVPKLDGLLRLAFSSGERSLRSGALGELREPGGSPLFLAPGQSAAVELSVSIPAGARPGWEAALVEIAVLLDSEDVQAASPRTAGMR